MSAPGCPADAMMMMTIMMMMMMLQNIHVCDRQGGCATAAEPLEGSDDDQDTGQGEQILARISQHTVLV